jgi:metal-dependent amidase/aminoacylase/carboxypeptidase family protein
VARTSGVLTRRVDPRAGINLVWGEVHAGSASNVIPRLAMARGTLRMLDRSVWEQMPVILDAVVRGVAEPYGVGVEIEHERGVPPVVNEANAVSELAVAAGRISSDATCDTEQSLGGEDFGWFLEKVPGALARLGVGRPGTERVDLHQPTFDVDESAIGIGVRLLANAVQLP